MQNELASLIENFTTKDGAFDTPIPQLRLFRRSAPTEPTHGTLNPMLAVVAQGAKQIVLAERTFRYDPRRYVLVSLALPVSAAVTEASREAPYLGLCLELDLKELAPLDFITKERETSGSKSVLGLAVSTLGPDLLDPICRLLQLLRSPDDIQVIAPLIRREIVYRLSQGDQGATLRRLVTNHGLSKKVERAVSWLQKHFDQPFSIAALAEESHMSASGLHHHFKRLTNMSPLQYQKHLRLQKARNLLLVEAMDAASAGYQVGYLSPSQFSREYTRSFGIPPSRDALSLRHDLRADSHKS